MFRNPNNVSILSMIAAWLGSAFAVIFFSGKYVNRLEHIEKTQREMASQFTDHDGENRLMSVPACVKTQIACQKLIDEKLSQHDKRFDKLEIDMDKHFQEAFTKLDDLRANINRN